MGRTDKWTVARILDEISHYIELSDPNPFKARAFERAARAVEKLDADIHDLIRTGGLYKTPGVGKAIGPVIEEVAASGGSKYLEELRGQYPPGIFDLLRIPGLGLKKIGQLHADLGIGSLDGLEEAARGGKLSKLRGFGAKTALKIIDGIEKARRRESQFLLPAGLEVAGWIREKLAAIDAVEDVEITGSVRRRLEIIRNVNLAVSTKDFDAIRSAIDQMFDQVEEIDERTVKALARNEIDVWFHLCKPNELGATVLRTTGSAEFVAKMGDAANAAARTEQELFKKAGIAFVEPERRENADDLSRKRRVRLVEPDDLRGTFHVHTTYSDGRNSMLEMLGAARDRGYEYVGISDHSKAAYYAGGLTEERLKEQHAEIDRHRKAVAPMRVFRGSEADILPDGSIDYGSPTLGLFDFVVASIHSRFNMPKDEMTERILRALDDPHVTFLGHLTGRLLLSRDGYSVDYDRIFERAAERGVVIEINGSPKRLDVDWRHIGRAIERGVVLSIHPDAHSIAEMSNVITGTWVARKAGLTAKQIFNTRSVEEVEEWLEARRSLRG
ncbi:MAG: histidinol-phosphatase [Thermoanaerobaculia bacterium]|nr:histidinol-phosphatase [Thermoanaerobaculia bacterium]